MVKIGVFLAFCLSILVCGPTDAKDPSNVPGLPSHFRHIDAKMDIAGGFGDVLMTEQPTFYSVQVPVGSARVDRKWTPPDLTGIGLQVWLLRADGSAIPQLQKPSIAMIGNFGSYGTTYMVYGFERDPTNDVARIVIQVNGRLYSREIGAGRK
jgi:hypothetical protein